MWGWVENWSRQDQLPTWISMQFEMAAICKWLNIYAFKSICFTMSTVFFTVFFQKNTFCNVNSQEEYIHSHPNIHTIFFYALIHFLELYGGRKDRLSARFFSKCFSTQQPPLRVWHGQPARFWYRFLTAHCGFTESSNAGGAHMSAWEWVKCSRSFGSLPIFPIFDKFVSQKLLVIKWNRPIFGLWVKFVAFTCVPDNFNH